MMGAFQPKTNIFPGNCNLFLPSLLCFQFFQFEVTLPQASKQKGIILVQEKYFKLLKDMIISTVGT